MLNSTLHLSTEPTEPANTIKTYLKVSLNSKQPCIYIQDQKLKAMSVYDYYQSQEKIIDQYELFNRIIEKLRVIKSVTSLDLKSLEVKVVYQSSSNDSLLQNQQINPGDEFLTHLIDINPVYCGERLLNRIVKMVISVAKESIFSMAKKSSPMEKFHKNAFINALECHRDLYLTEIHRTSMNRSPRFIPNITNSLFLQNSIFVIENTLKKLSDDAIYQLIHYWISSDKSSFCDPTKSCVNAHEEMQKYINKLTMEDQELISEHQLFKFSTAAKIYQECIIRKLANPALGTFADDIDRHLPRVSVKFEKFNIFSYDKKESSKKSKKTEIEIENYVKFFESTLNQLSVNSDLIKKIIDKYKNCAKEVVKNNVNISIACKDFIKLLLNEEEIDPLTGFIKKLSVDEVAISKKFYYILCPLTQQTYAQPAAFIQSMLSHLSVIFEKGVNSRSYEYEFINDKVNVTVSINGSTKECGGVNFQTVIALKSTINNLESWSSEISIKLPSSINKHKEEVRKKIILPLENLGFVVVN